jgi:hypothetical protein
MIISLAMLSITVADQAGIRSAALQRAIGVDKGPDCKRERKPRLGNDVIIEAFFSPNVGSEAWLDRTE